MAKETSDPAESSQDTGPAADAGDESSNSPSEQGPVTGITTFPASPTSAPEQDTPDPTGAQQPLSRQSSAGIPSATVLSPVSDDNRHGSLAEDRPDTLTARVSFGAAKGNAGMVVKPLRIRKRALDVSSRPTPSSPASEVNDHFTSAETVLKAAKKNTKGPMSPSATSPSGKKPLPKSAANWSKVRAGSFLFTAVTETKDGAVVPNPASPVVLPNSRSIKDLTEVQKQAYQYAAACILAPFATGTASNMSTDTWAFLNSNSLLNRSTAAVGWFVDSMVSIVGAGSAQTPGEAAIAKLMDEETDVALDFTISSRDRPRYVATLQVLADDPNPGASLPKSYPTAKEVFELALRDFLSDFLGPDGSIPGVPSSTARSAAAWKDVFAAFAQKALVAKHGLSSRAPEYVALATVEFMNIILAVHASAGASSAGISRGRSSSSASGNSYSGGSRAERVQAQRLEELRDAFGLTKLDHLTLLNRARVASTPAVVLGQLKARAAAATQKHPMYGRQAWGDGPEGDAAWEMWKDNELRDVDSLIRFFEAQQALAEAAAAKKAEAEAARLSAMLIPNLSAAVTGGASRRLLARSAPVRAKLCVEVLRAQELPALDSGGTSDPYVSLRLLSAKGDKISDKVETAVKHADLSPEWNENFVLDVTEPDGSLRLKIVDKDRHTRDDIIGEAVVPLSEVADGTVHEMWLNIVPRFSLFNYHSTGGRLFVRLQIVKPSGAHLSADADKQQSASTPTSGGDKETSEELKAYSRVDWPQLFNELMNALLGASLKEHQTNQEAQGISPMVFWMLEEFANRYGLGTTQARLLYLDRLQSISHPTHWPVILSSLTDVMDMLKAESGAVPLTQKEDALFSDLLARLNEDVRLSIQRYKLYFPENTPDGVLRTICDVLSVLFGKDPGVDHEAVSWTISEYLRAGFAETWTQMLAVHEHPDLSAASAGYTAVQLAHVAEAIVSELETDIAYFSGERAFPSSIKVASMAAKHYVSEYVDALRLFTSACPTSALNQDMFELYFKVKELQSSLDSLLPGERDVLQRLPITELWLPYVLAWAKETHAKVGEWTRTAVKIDAWEPIGADVMHSTSSVDMWAAWTQAIDYLSSLEWPGSLNPVLSGLCEAVADVVEEYADTLVEGQKQANVRIRLNNLEYVRRQLVRFIEELNDVDKNESNLEHLEEALRETFGVIRTAQDTLVEDIVSYLSPFMTQTINDLFKVVREEVERATGGKVEKSSSWWGGRRRSRSRSRSASPAPPPKLPEETVSLAMAALTDYLDAELGRYMDQLYDAMFMRLLKKLWGVIAGVLEDNVAPTSSRSEITPTDVALVHAALRPLHDFFYADGAGLSRTYLKNNSAVVLSLVECYSRPTSALIAQYMREEANATTRSVMGTAMLRLLRARGSKHDRDAGKFIDDMEKIEKLRDKWKEWVVEHPESSDSEGDAAEPSVGASPAQGGKSPALAMSTAAERRRRRQRRLRGSSATIGSAFLQPPPASPPEPSLSPRGNRGSSASLATSASTPSKSSRFSRLFHPPTVEESRD